MVRKTKMRGHIRVEIRVHFSVKGKAIRDLVDRDWFDISHKCPSRSGNSAAQGIEFYFTLSGNIGGEDELTPAASHMERGLMDKVEP